MTSRSNLQRRAPSPAVADLESRYIMNTAKAVAVLFAIVILGVSAPRACGESDADLIARTISSSPKTPGSYVEARIEDCSLILHQVSPGEKKRTVIPLTDLDERSFKSGIAVEFGWYVEVHTQQQRHAIKTGSAKWSARLADYALYIEGQENAERLRGALVRLVRFCRRTHNRANHAMERTAHRGMRRLKDEL
jgi:hypothetical protein